MDRRLDPLYRLIPHELRGFPPIEETNYTWDQYDRALSEHEDQEMEEEALYGAEMEQARLLDEELQYRRYRMRFGQRRFRPSDNGTESIYIEIPLPENAPDGSFHSDYGQLSPSNERLKNFGYREHIRPWFDTLDPAPSTTSELEEAWQQQWRVENGFDAQPFTPPPSPLPPTHFIPSLTPDGDIHIIMRNFVNERDGPLLSKTHCLWYSRYLPQAIVLSVVLYVCWYDDAQV